MMGVEYDLFWTLNPKSLTPFIRAFELKNEYEDRLMWQNGLYVRMAIATLFDKKAKYPEQPLSVPKRVVDEEVESNYKMNKIKRAMLERMTIVNHQLEKKEVTTDE